MDLFSAVSAEDMQAARIVTGATMALFLAVGLVPGLRKQTGTIRLVLLAIYLLTCVGFIV